MVDTEGEFGRIPFSPRDNRTHKIRMLVSYLLSLDYSIRTLKGMVQILKKNKIPATFFFVGALFLKKKNKYILREYLKTDIKTKYLLNKKKLYSIIPTWGEFIEKEMKDNLFEISIHNFLHESNFSETNSTISKSIKFSIRAAKEIGFNPKTYAAPWFELEEPNRPERIYKILKESGILLTRFDGVRKKYGNLIRIKTREGFFKRYGLDCVHSSYFVKSGRYNKNELKKIEAGIIEAIKKKGVYTLSMHDTTFLRHGLKHFWGIIKIIKKYEDQLYVDTLYNMFTSIKK